MTNCLIGLIMILSVSQGRSQTSILWSESSGTSGTIQKTYCATDLIGNIYMATSVNGNGLDFRIVSWRPDSVMRWTYTYDGSSNSDDVVAGIVVDSSFNVYVCGTTKENNNDDITLIALDSAGQHHWTQHFDRSGGNADVATGITKVGDGIYVCGSSSTAATGYDYTVLKYHKLGFLIWSRFLDGVLNGNDYCNAIDADKHGTNGNMTAGPFGTGTNFIIHVIARFSNGETIDQCLPITLSNGPVDYVAVEIRGDINDYSSVFTNYQVDVYQIP